MRENYKEINSKIMQDLSKMSVEMGDVMKGFHVLHQAAIKEGVLSKKTKELIALALGVASHCKGCIAFHMQALVQLGVTKQEILEMLGVVILMGGGPSVMYATEALNAFDELSK